MLTYLVCVPQKISPFFSFISITIAIKLDWKASQYKVFQNRFWLKDLTERQKMKVTYNRE